jgi:hypothetical protein
VRDGVADIGKELVKTSPRGALFDNWLVEDIAEGECGECGEPGGIPS